MTLVPREKGRALMWDAMYVDTFAPSHLSGKSVRDGAATVSAEDLRRRKYASTELTYYCIFASFFFLYCFLCKIKL